MDLPLNSLYCPTINMRVVSRKCIGSGSIPLAPYLPWSNEEVRDTWPGCVAWYKFWR